MDERRRYIRIDESLKISYRVVSPPDGWGNSTSMNISEGGISFPIDQRLLPGLILDLRVNLSGSMEPIEATGEVIWINNRTTAQFPYVVGVKFVKIDLRGRDRIYYHIHRRIDEGKPSDIGWIE